MTQQATTVEPNASVRKLTLSKETVTQLTGSERSGNRNPTHTCICFTKPKHGCL